MSGARGKRGGIGSALKVGLDEGKRGELRKANAEVGAGLATECEHLWDSPVSCHRDWTDSLSQELRGRN